MRRAFLLSPPRDRAAPRAWSRNAAWPLMFVAAAGSVVLLLVLGSGLTFFHDEWNHVLHRRGFTVDTFMRPDNANVIVGSLAMYKALLAVFGMDSTMPFRILANLFFLATALLLFVYLRRCVGDWLALLGSVVVLFLGAAWEDLLWPWSGLVFADATAAGLGTLLALQRQDRLGDAVACALLVLAVALSSVGVAFVAGAAVHVALDRERWRTRAYIVAAPLLLYVLWFVGWGHTDESALSLHNAVRTPRFVVEGIGAGISALLGLFAFKSPVKESVVGRSLLFAGGAALVAGLAFLTWRMQRAGGSLMARLRGTPRSLWVVVATGLAFWILVGINQEPGRAPTTSRYQYPAAVFTLLVVAEAFRGARIGIRAKIVATAVAVAAVVGNLVALVDGQRFLQRESDHARAALGGLEIARETAHPAFALRPSISGSPYLGHVVADSYFSAVDAFGSPADSPADLARAPERSRAAADVVLAHALRVALEPDDGTAGSCVLHEGTTANRRGLALPAGGAVLRAAGGEPAQVRLRRFAAEAFPVEVGTLRGDATAVLRIPEDRASEPWELGVVGSRAVTVCGLGGP